MFKFSKNITKYLPIFYGLFLGSLIVGYAISNIMLGLLITIGVLLIIKNKKVKFNRLYIPLLIYIVWGVSSLLWTTNVEKTINGVGKQISFLLIPFFLSQYPKIKFDEIIIIFRIFSICLLVYFFTSIGIAFNLYRVDHEVYHFFYHDLTSLFENNAIYISVFTSLAVLGMINISYKKKKSDYIIILFLLIYLILLSSKNLLFTTLFIQMLLVLIFNINRKQKKIILTGVFIIIAFFSLFMFFDSPLKERYLAETNFKYSEIFIREFFDDYDFNGTTLRLFQIRSGIEMFINNNIGVLGVGLSNAQQLLDDYYIYYNVPRYLSYNFHNQYMQTSIEVGIIGGVLLLVMLFFPLIKSLQSKNLVLFAFIIIMAFLFITESFLNRQKGILFFVFSYCVFINFKREKEIK